MGNKYYNLYNNKYCKHNLMILDITYAYTIKLILFIYYF